MVVLVKHTMRIGDSEDVQYINKGPCWNLSQTAVRKCTGMANLSKKNKQFEEYAAKYLGTRYNGKGERLWYIQYCTSTNLPEGRRHGVEDLGGDSAKAGKAWHRGRLHMKA